MGIKNEQIIKISDLKLAAAVSLNIPILRLDKIGTRINFIFIESKQLNDLISSYWRRDLLVSALEYANQIDALKTRVYEELGK